MGKWLWVAVPRGGKACVPANMDELPEWLQEDILTETAQGVGYLLCEGTWDGQHAYFFWHGFSSTLGVFISDENVCLAFIWRKSQ